MLRAAAKSLATLTLFAGLVAGATAGVWYYQRSQATAWEVRRLEEERRQLDEQNQQLQTVVRRLTDERRVAEVLVTDQQQSAGGVLRTSLLFVEYAKDGTTA